MEVFWTTTGSKTQYEQDNHIARFTIQDDRWKVEIRQKNWPSSEKIVASSEGTSSSHEMAKIHAIAAAQTLFDNLGDFELPIEVEETIDIRPPTS